MYLEKYFLKLLQKLQEKICTGVSLHKQPLRGVLRKRCSENMQQIYRRTHPCRKDFNKAASNFIETRLRHGCSPVNLLYIFGTTFSNNNSGWLLLSLLDKSTGWRPSFLFKRFQCRYFRMYIGNFYRIPSLGWLAHLVGRFACNTRRAIVEASSNPPVSNVKSL